MTHPILKFFERKEHSQQWPSSDPKDKPTVTYACKLCKWKETFVVYGNFPMYAPNPEDVALQALRDHLLMEHIFLGIQTIEKFVRLAKYVKKESKVRRKV